MLEHYNRNSAPTRSIVMTLQCSYVLSAMKLLVIFAYRCVSTTGWRILLIVICIVFHFCVNQLNYVKFVGLMQPCFKNDHRRFSTTLSYF